MNKTLLLVIITLTVLALTGSALALAPMGPPTAGLKTGQFRAGADYSYSNVDLKVEWDGEDTYTAKDITMNMISANIGYGLTDDWEGFVRLGAGNAAGDEDDFGSATGDYKFVWGLGTKYTFLKQENLDWGVLFQIGWLKTKFSDSGTDAYYDEELGDYIETWTDDYELSVYNMEIAVGPTWKAAEGLSIYGGPFFNITRGDIDEDWSWTDTYEDESTDSGSGSDSADVKEKSMFGGYVGAQWDFMQSASAFGEFQFTGAGWTFATGVGWKF